MAGKNLTTTKINTWQKNVRKDIEKTFIASLKKVKGYTTMLSSITSTADNDEKLLSESFAKLSETIGSAITSLTNCLTEFDTSLTEYLNAEKANEEQTAAASNKTLNELENAANALKNAGK